MKYIARFTKLLFATLLCGVFMTACTKTDRPDITLPDNNNNNNNNNNDSLHSDTLADHLLFLKSTKKTGSPPQAPGGSSLQISFEDTLYLTDEIFRAIKFLHKETTQNVAGAFIHLLAVSGSTASYYYDVPEVPDMEESDTVSVIMIAIDPTGLIPPQTSAIKIIPYDESGAPINEIIRPLKLTENKNDPNVNNGSCGLILPQGDVWEWEMSYVLPPNSDTFGFYNDPFKVHSPEGQDIQGRCCDGISRYPGNCPGDTTGNIGVKRLHFATYYMINFENFMFFDNGTFFRHTLEDAPLPIPGASDFCGSGPGIVQLNLNRTEYDGNWTIQTVTMPPDLPLFPDQMPQLLLQTTSSTGTGFGNPGGVIDRADCETGSMVLIQLDREGGKNHLFKIYHRRKAGEDPLWYKM